MIRGFEGETVTTTGQQLINHVEECNKYRGELQSKNSSWSRWWNI